MGPACHPSASTLAYLSVIPVLRHNRHHDTAGRHSQQPRRSHAKATALPVLLPAKQPTLTPGVDVAPLTPYFQGIMNCPVCHTETFGAYCQSCGAPAASASCGACKTTLLAGARFCTGCGAPVRATASRLPWYLAAASMAALIVVLLFPAVRPGGNSSPGFTAAGSGPAGEMTGRAAPLTGTPREQADRLFNRVMQAQGQGDNDQVAFFLPMAVLAYRQAGELDTDGLYHLSLLETASGDPDSGLMTAERILQNTPDHLLARAAAAQAADALQDAARARRYYERFLDAFQEERGKPIVEYMDHSAIFSAYHEEAEKYLGR